ncbi:MAG: hypothetical protein IJE25_03525 [Clostridia bacterium]|nr:hypothetical protein [Clostridia bacterium]
MYSRSYAEPEREARIPQNYNGCAFENEEKNEENATRPPTNEVFSQIDESKSSARGDESAAAFSPLGSLFSFGKGIFGSFLGGKLSLPKIGTEEILIIATALFLLFSRDGDKTCAVILLLLLLIN